MSSHLPGRVIPYLQLHWLYRKKSPPAWKKREKGELTLSTCWKNLKRNFMSCSVMTEYSCIQVSRNRLLITTNRCFSLLVSCTLRYSMPCTFPSPSAHWVFLRVVFRWVFKLQQPLIMTICAWLLRLSLRKPLVVGFAQVQCCHLSNNNSCLAVSRSRSLDLC